MRASGGGVHLGGRFLARYPPGIASWESGQGPTGVLGAQPWRPVSEPGSPERWASRVAFCCWGGAVPHAARIARTGRSLKK